MGPWRSWGWMNFTWTPHPRRAFVRALHGVALHDCHKFVRHLGQLGFNELHVDATPELGPAGCCNVCGTANRCLVQLVLQLCGWAAEAGRTWVENVLGACWSPSLNDMQDLDCLQHSTEVQLAARLPPSPPQAQRRLAALRAAAGGRPVQLPPWQGHVHSSATQLKQDSQYRPMDLRVVGAAAGGGAAAAPASAAPPAAQPAPAQACINGWSGSSGGGGGWEELLRLGSVIAAGGPQWDVLPRSLACNHAAAHGKAGRC